MTLVVFVVGAVVVVAIAFIAIGRVVGDLAVERPPAVYDLHDAAHWIGDRLPDEVTARLSYEDVAEVLGWHLDWFSEVGAASRYGEELATDAIRTDGAVAPDEAAVDAVVARSLATGGPDAVDVVCVLDLQMKYLVAIGAVGEQAD
ncbi:MAG: hypothetical protein R8F63_04610 [Acidimicrobiales bacterium]|nr:hypothetical protein [Acidimicrobiales bacterium]